MQTLSDTRHGVSTNAIPSHLPLAGNPFSSTYQGLQYFLPGTGFRTGQKDDVSQAFGALGIHNMGSNTMGKAASPNITSNMAQLPTSNYGHSNSPMYYMLSDGRSFLGNQGGPQNGFQQVSAPYNFNPSGQYFQSPNYQTTQAMPNASQAVMWNGNQQTSNDVPELAAPRHNSLSSNEEVGPRTPFFGAQTPGTFPAKVTVPDNSPQTWGTPSPQQIGQPMQPQQLAKTSNGQYVVIDLDALCLQAPAIPKPIPAIFSGEKGRGTLESSLVNRFNTTNVYIRGLHPDTSDSILFDYGARFGSIESAKSMLDQHNNLCKGFGFIKYHNFADGENCIRGFFHWGYEAKWARVSHNERLKKLSDEGNTNLYISNIPADINFNEHSLSAIFVPRYNCCSAKILRDPNGLSRGVGFARFETPEQCKEIIQEYNGKPVGHEGLPINIRFADTPDQKKLKTVTQERRQFKTHEYNVAAFGPNSPYQQYSPLAASFSSPLQSRSPVISGQWTNTGPFPTLYPQYQPTVSSYQSPMVPATVNLKTPASENVAPNGRYNARVKIETPPASRSKSESPIATALAKRNASIQSPAKSGADTLRNRYMGDEADRLEFKSTRAEAQDDLRSSPSKSSKSSPRKILSSKGNLLKL